ncbi:uncharacterized protein LOC119665350, partial [Teleopsis dalmanni]|uniref:uncharacterized protein LOC119665350 n=1 Tax=Teleopsis dalmanni TaxID=139649 RepID=UPI0018CFED9D
MTILVTILMMPLILSKPIEEISFPNKPGIYFEGIGTVNQIIGRWKIITYFEFAPIRKEIERFQNGTAALQQLCPLLQQQESCYELVRQFNNTNIELRTETKVMTRHRSARGAINIVGNIANKLFGVLDSEYAETISKTLTQINNNEDVLSKMIKNQTTVMDSTINIFSKTTEAIAVKLNQLQDETNKIVDYTNHNTKRINHLEIYTSLVTQLTWMAHTLMKIEAAIFDVLTDTQHGRINSLLMSPQQLQDQIMKIKGHLPHSLRLPFNQEDVIHLYTLMSSQSGITQDHLIVVLQLPLTDHEDFDLFNLVPIPATVNNTMMTIVPEASFLAATPHRDQYFALTREQYKECMIFKQPENKLLCSDKQSKYNTGSQVYACEFNLLKNISDNTCNVQETKSNIIWSPLYHANQWIFGSKNNTTVTAVCKGITTHLELQGATLLKLQDDCVLKHQTSIIQTHQTLTDTMYESYIAFGEIPVINNSELWSKFKGSSLNLSNELK